MVNQIIKLQNEEAIVENILSAHRKPIVSSRVGLGVSTKCLVLEPLKKAVLVTRQNVLQFGLGVLRKSDMLWRGVVALGEDRAESKDL